MIQRATFVGELASRALAWERAGEVTRTFERSLYVRVGSDFILLLWGEIRSPMTVNMAIGSAAPLDVKVGDRCGLSGSKIDLGRTAIDLGGSETYRTSLLMRHRIVLPGLEELAKGVAMVKLLYDASPHGPTLPSDSAFRAFAGRMLARYAAGNTDLLDFGAFIPLVGRGGGFTPAGDDFAAGITATFNYIARNRRVRQIAVPKAALLETVPESGAILVYSSRGYVDEGLERLILDSLDGRSGFFLDLESLGTRGHTSGMDLSLGVLLAEAYALERSGRRGAIGKCLRALAVG